jgi:uncharacterized membrane protein
MAFGPVDFTVIRFPGNEFSGEILPALKEVIDADVIRIIDLLFVTKDADGAVAVVEEMDLDEAAYLGWDPIIGDVTGLLSEDDAISLAESLEANSSAVLLMIEHSWANKLVSAIQHSKGEVLISERIPRAVIEEMAAVAAE